MNSMIPTVCFFLILGFFQRAPGTGAGESESISGHVFYKNGSPVKDANVEVHYFGGMAMILPTTQTDAHGYFSISSLQVGEVVVSASKVDEGFPNAAIAMYGRKGYTSLKRIDTASVEALEDMNLRFIDPDAVIDWTVQSAATHAPIEGAGFTVSWSDDPRIFYRSSISKDGNFQFVLPKHRVTVKITAPGFADWFYTDEHNHLHNLFMKPGARDRRIIYLK